MAEKSPISENVQALIDKLHFEGVKAGSEDARLIVQKAKQEAAKIIDDAQKEADRLRAEAHAMIEKEKSASEAAFKTSLRDSVLTLKTQLFLQFKNQLQKQISTQMDDEKFLETLILTIAKAAISEEAQNINILVGEIKDYENRRDRLIEAIASKMLEDGIALGTGRDKGIKIKLIDQEVEVDLSEEALTELIYQLIIPRYRELFEGVKS